MALSHDREDRNSVGWPRSDSPIELRHVGAIGEITGKVTALQS